MDVICVKDTQGNTYCTDFYVKFKQALLLENAAVAVVGKERSDQSRNSDGTAGENNTIKNSNDSVKGPYDAANVEREQISSSSSSRADYVDLDAISLCSGCESFTPVQESHLVKFFCNDRPCKEVVAFVAQQNGFVYFFEEELKMVAKTPSTNLLLSFDLQPGANKVECLHEGSGTRKCFTMWLYGLHDNLVIMDIDGTITKSDVTGYIQTVYMGKFSYIHEGVVPFLNILVETYKYRIIYLTARPMVHQKETRSFLEGIRDDNGLTMPPGPLFPSKDHMMAALYREIITKTTLQLKASILNEIARVFSHAGSRRISPYVLGIGNKENDALAYNLVGMNAEKILLIDKQSNITIWKYSSYNQLTGTSTATLNSANSGRSISSTNSNIMKNINVFSSNIFRGWATTSSSGNDKNNNRSSGGGKDGDGTVFNKESSSTNSNSNSSKRKEKGSKSAPITTQPTDFDADFLHRSSIQASLPDVSRMSDHSIIPDHFDAVMDSDMAEVSRLRMDRGQSEPLSPFAMQRMAETSSKKFDQSSDDTPLSTSIVDFNTLRDAASSSMKTGDENQLHMLKKGTTNQQEGLYLETGGLDKPFMMRSVSEQISPRKAIDASSSTAAAGTARGTTSMTDKFTRSLGNRYGVDLGTAAKLNDTVPPKFVFHTYKDLDLIKYVDKLSGLNLY